MTDVLRHWHLPDAVRESAELITSELMTNAIKVTGAENRRLSYGELSTVPTVRLRLRLIYASLFIEVWDPDDTPPVASNADPYGESGRGLVIVNALATTWGFSPTQGGGKVVWAELRMM